MFNLFAMQLNTSIDVTCTFYLKVIADSFDLHVYIYTLCAYKPTCLHLNPNENLELSTHFLLGLVRSIAGVYTWKCHTCSIVKHQNRQSKHTCTLGLPVRVCFGSLLMQVVYIQHYVQLVLKPT